MKKLALTLTLLSGLTLSSMAPLQARHRYRRRRAMIPVVPKNEDSALPQKFTNQQKQASPRLIAILKKKYIKKEPLTADEQKYFDQVKTVVGVSGLTLLLMGIIGGLGWTFYDASKQPHELPQSYEGPQGGPVGYHPAVALLEAAGFVFQDDEQPWLLGSFLDDVWNNRYDLQGVLRGEVNISGKEFLQPLFGEEKKEQAKRYRKLYFEISKNPLFLGAIKDWLDVGWNLARGLPKLRLSPDGDDYELYYTGDLFI